MVEDGINGSELCGFVGSIRRGISSRGEARRLCYSRRELFICTGMFLNNLLQTLEGLAYLAERNIAHRDLRSDNILISKDGIVKLGKFIRPVRKALAEHTKK